MSAQATSLLLLGLLAAVPGAGPAPTAAEAKLREGDQSWEKDEYGEASVAYKEAEALFARGDGRGPVVCGQVTALLGQARALFSSLEVAEQQEAVRAYDRAKGLASGQTDGCHLPEALRNEASLLAKKSDFMGKKNGFGKGALLAAEQAIQIYVSAADLRSEGETLLEAGTEALDRQKERNQGHRWIEDARKIFEKLSDHRGVSRSYLAEALDPATGLEDEVETRVIQRRLLEKARVELVAAGDKRGLGRYEMLQARLLPADFAKDLASYERARGYFEEEGDLDGAAEALTEEAVLYAKHHDHLRSALCLETAGDSWLQADYLPAAHVAYKEAAKQFAPKSPDAARLIERAASVERQAKERFLNGHADWRLNSSSRGLDGSTHLDNDDETDLFWRLGWRGSLGAQPSASSPLAKATQEVARLNADLTEKFAKCQALLDSAEVNTETLDFPAALDQLARLPTEFAALTSVYTAREEARIQQASWEISTGGAAPGAGSPPKPSALDEKSAALDLWNYGGEILARTCRLEQILESEFGKPELAEAAGRCLTEALANGPPGADELLGPPLAYSGPELPGVIALARSLARAGKFDRETGKAFSLLSGVARWDGDVGAELAALTKARTLFQQAGSSRGVAYTWALESVLHLEKIDPRDFADLPDAAARASLEKAVQAAQTSLRLLEPGALPSTRLAVLGSLLAIEAGRDRIASATSYAEEILALSRAGNLADCREDEMSGSESAVEAAYAFFVKQWAASPMSRLKALLLAEEWLEVSNPQGTRDEGATHRRSTPERQLADKKGDRCERWNADNRRSQLTGSDLAGIAEKAGRPLLFLVDLPGVRRAFLVLPGDLTPRVSTLGLTLWEGTKFRDRVEEGRTPSPKELEQERALYAAFFAPFETALAGFTHLTLIASPRFRALPFAALPSAPGQLLHERFALSLVSSADLLKPLESRAPAVPTGAPLLVMGKLSPAAATRLTRRFPASDLPSPALLDLPTLRRMAPGAQRLLIATPGFGKSLEIEPSPDHGDRLSAEEIRSLKLHADTVVLLACDAASDGRREALEGSNVASAFLSAGARRVLAPLWKVPREEVTFDFLDSFFAGLTGGGSLSNPLAADEALAYAQREARRRNVPSYVWAGWVLLGPSDKP